MTPVASAAAAAVVSILATTVPAQSADTLLRDHANDLSAYLPRPYDVPWLWRRTARQPATMPEAGTVRALLFNPRPITAWPNPPIQSAEAGPASIGM